VRHRYHLAQRGLELAGRDQIADRVKGARYLVEERPVGLVKRTGLGHRSTDFAFAVTASAVF
jgi:hypothetical protein